MTQYAIIETDDGMTVTPLPPDGSAEAVAEERGALVVDPGPFPNYTDAYEALLALIDDDADEEVV